MAKCALRDLTRNRPNFSAYLDYRLQENAGEAHDSMIAFIQDKASLNATSNAGEIHLDVSCR